jgi:hypothetical protein
MFDYKKFINFKVLTCKLLESLQPARRGQPALPKINFIMATCFFIVRHFIISISGSRDPKESGSNTDPEHWQTAGLQLPPLLHLLYTGVPGTYILLIYPYVAGLCCSPFTSTSSKIQPQIYLIIAVELEKFSSSTASSSLT